jgi:hypothetical protein
MTFAFVLALVMAVQTEPLDQRMAPRAIALEISKVARTPIEAAVLVVMAWEESRLIPNAIGDHGRARCAFQLQHASVDVLTDLRKCVEVAHDRLVASAEACPDAPLAVYASGSCGLARKLSARRMALAERLLLLVE